MARPSRDGGWVRRDARSETKPARRRWLRARSGCAPVAGLAALHLALGCASAPAPAAAPPPLVSASPSADLVALGLEAAGYEASERAAVAAALETRLAPVLAEARAVEPSLERARRLLQGLHRDLLRQYDARATTLRELLEDGRFNCVSSALLFAAAAARIELEVQAELLPTHARLRLRLPEPEGGRAVIVETTAAAGVDPDPGSLDRILDRALGVAEASARVLVADAGAVFEPPALVAATWVNRASVAQEAEDLATAERLFARGEAMAEAPEMRRMLRDQRAALLSQLAADDVLDGAPSRVRRAFATMLAAAALEPADPPIRAAVAQNLRAAAERVFAAAVAAGDEAGIRRAVAQAVAVGAGPELPGLTAFARSEIARLRAARGDVEGALEAIEAALAEPLDAADAELRATLEHNRVAALRIAAGAAAERGDLVRSAALFERLEALPGTGRDARAAWTEDKKRAYQLAAQKRYRDGDLVGAAELYREGLRAFPGEALMRTNLAVVLAQLARGPSEAGRCDEAEPWLSELEALEPGAPGPRAARVRCLTLRASARLSAGDDAEAVALLRSAHEADPGDPTTATNLARAILRWIASEAEAGRCARAMALGRELDRISGPPPTPGRLARALGPCAR
jgi:tetratricopeptide (TPR) repeat protein